MKNLVSHTILLFLLVLLISCVSNENIIKDDSKLLICGREYTHIFLTNELDTINGYYYVQNDSLFFLSKSDYNRYDSILNTYTFLEDNINPYFLFSLNMQNLYLSELNSSILESISECPDFRDLRNIFYPPKQLNDSTYTFEQHAVLYGNYDPYIRVFVVTKDLKIKSFSTQGKNPEYYFFYN